MSSAGPALRIAAIALLFAMAGCNAGQSEQRAGAAASAVSEVSLPSSAAPPPQAAPTATGAAPASGKEALIAPAAGAAAPVLPEAGRGRRCSSDSDCLVKDVGSCCGYRPQCLNKDTPTFPEQVKAQCAKEGRVSTCGMLAVSGCQCVSGQCENLLQSDDSLAPAAQLQ